MVHMIMLEYKVCVCSGTIYAQTWAHRIFEHDHVYISFLWQVFLLLNLELLSSVKMPPTKLDTCRYIHRLLQNCFSQSHVLALPSENRVQHSQIIWAMIDREYCRPYCSSSPEGVLYIHNLYFREKLFFPSFDSTSHLPHNLLLSPNELLQTAFQTVPPSSPLVISSSYRVYFSYRNSQHC